MKFIIETIHSLEYFRPFFNLESLELIQCQICDLRGLDELRSLKSLDLTENKIRSLETARQSQFPGISLLNLSGNRIGRRPASG